MRFTHADVEIPFAHDFNTSLHGWTLGSYNWKWTGNSDPPDTANIPLFYSAGHYTWSQKKFSIMKSDDSFPQYLRYKFIIDASHETKLHFDYWFYTMDAGAGCLTVYVLEEDKKYLQLRDLNVIIKNSNGWETLTVDCSDDKCCSKNKCNLQIFIYGSVGSSDGRGLIALRSVSASSTTELNSSSASSTTETSSALAFKTSKLIVMSVIGIHSFLF